MVALPTLNDPLGEGPFPSRIGEGGCMAKRLILEQTPHDRITCVLEKLRSAGIKAPAGAMVDSDPVILVEQA
jgi:hypothetical protein